MGGCIKMHTSMTPGFPLLAELHTKLALDWYDSVHWRFYKCLSLESDKITGQHSNVCTGDFLGLSCKDGLPVIHVGHSLSIVRMSCSSTEWPWYWHSNNRLRSVSRQCYIFFKVGGIWNWFCTHQPLVIKLIISYKTDIKKNCQLPKTVFSPLHKFAPFLSKNVPNL